jgi:hypothetical protein
MADARSQRTVREMPSSTNPRATILHEQNGEAPASRPDFSSRITNSFTTTSILNPDVKSSSAFFAHAARHNTIFTYCMVFEP